METQFQVLKYYAGNELDRARSSSEIRWSMKRALVRLLSHLRLSVSDKDYKSTEYNLSVLQSRAKSKLITRRAWQRHSAYICCQPESSLQK